AVATSATPRRGPAFAAGLRVWDPHPAARASRAPASGTACAPRSAPCAIRGSSAGSPTSFDLVPWYLGPPYPVRFLKLLAPAIQAGGAALAALWTFPSMLLSAFLVAWGAEAAQFLISQGLALAILAWLQPLPEFAVEAVIAWEAGGNPGRSHLAIANLTGAIRLLLGLRSPMIYFVFAVSGRRRGDTKLGCIVLQPEHAVEVIGLIPPLLYFVVIVWKQTLSWFDAVVLLLLYVAYLRVLLRNPPHN